MDAKEAGWFFRAFGDGTRLRIVGALSKRGMRVSELARLLRRPVPSVSRHLRYLHARGLVDWRKLSSGVVYSLAPPAHTLHKRVLSAFQACLHTIDDVRNDVARVGKRPAGRREA